MTIATGVAMAAMRILLLSIVVSVPATTTSSIGVITTGDNDCTKKSVPIAAWNVVIVAKAYTASRDADGTSISIRIKRGRAAACCNRRRRCVFPSLKETI